GAENRVEQTGEALLELVAPERDDLVDPLLLAGDDPGLVQHLEVVAGGGLLHGQAHLTALQPVLGRTRRQLTDHLETDRVGQGLEDGEDVDVGEVRRNGGVGSCTHSLTRVEQLVYDVDRTIAGTAWRPPTLLAKHMSNGRSFLSTHTTQPSIDGGIQLTRRAWGGLLVLCGALFLDALDVSMIAVAL